MTGDDFGLPIHSPRLKRVFEHWWQARGNRLMPVWRDICPAKIKAELPIVWSFRYDATQDEFFGGIAGDAIQRLLGGPIKGVQFRKIQGADTHLFARAKRVLIKPAIFVGRGLLFRQRDRQCYGERLMLPFAGLDGRAGGVFGATDYRFAFLYTSGHESRGEVEYWADLKASGHLLPTRFWDGGCCSGSDAAEMP